MDWKSATLAVAACGIAAWGGVTWADTPEAASAAPTPAPMPDASSDQGVALHLQATDVWQHHPTFRSPFEGANSLPGHAGSGNTLNASVFFGIRPWKDAQLWLDVDMNQGFAPGNTLGVAGYVNGEGAKVGHHSPYFRVQRALYRQTFDL